MVFAPLFLLKKFFILWIYFFVLPTITIEGGKSWGQRIRKMKLRTKRQVKVRQQKTANSYKNNNKQDFKSANFDPLGSYTGINSDNEYEKPVQDADDL